MSDDESARNRSHRWHWTVFRRWCLWGLGGMAIVAMISIALLVVCSIGVLGESNDSPTRSQIETFTGVHIPPSTRDLKARLDLVITKRTLMARLTIEPSELSALVKDSPFKELLSLPNQPDQLNVSDPPSWWTPHRARTFLTATARKAAILVDTGGVDGYVVYLIARSD
jgi:hypothetical protein